ncbi:MAG: GldM family protein, partial [Bacteroidia bacterium]
QTKSDGVILKKGDVFYVRVKRKGIVKAEVFANLTYGRVKIAEQEFTVRELQPPIPFINGYFNGNDIKTTDLKELKKLSLKTDEYLVNEEVYIAEFDFMKIFNNETSVTKPVKNIGSSFNSLVAKLISGAKPGDVFIFSNIKTKSSLGTETSIAPLTIKIK